MPAAPRSDPAAAAVLAALPAAVFVIDAMGTVLHATDRAAALVGRTPAELLGESVLTFVNASTAWAYAATVAMATDFPDTDMGPMRITFLAPDGTARPADLWASNHLDDPHIGGIVCLLTDETAAMGYGEAMAALAEGEPLTEVASQVTRAMRGHPLVGDAAVVVPVGGSGGGAAAVGAGGTADAAGGDGDGFRALASALVHPAGLDGQGPPPARRHPGEHDAGTEPWRVTIATGARVLHADLDRLSEAWRDAARAAGYAAVWVEPVPAPAGAPPGSEAQAALVLWRRRPGDPSPNQLHSLHQAAALLAVAFSVAADRGGLA